MSEKKNILITGASGLIGSRLTELLRVKGYNIMHLGRSKRSNVKSFTWDVENGSIEPGTFDGIDTIVHLAGAGVADKRWTTQRKREILESRTQSTRLLFDKLSNQPHQVKNFISASAIGYYGFNDPEKIFKESDLPGNDFLAQITRQWENEIDAIERLDIRVVKLRIGIVLSEKGGALKELAKPVRMMAGAPLGSGDQYMSWIHIDDLCEMFVKAIEDENMHDAYNAVGIKPVTNREMTYAVGKALGKPIILPAVPAFALRLMLGEMADIVLKGSKVSSEKIQRAGFKFKFDNLQSALRDLLSN